MKSTLSKTSARASLIDASIILGSCIGLIVIFLGVLWCVKMRNPQDTETAYQSKVQALDCTTPSQKYKDWKIRTDETWITQRFSSLTACVICIETFQDLDTVRPLQCGHVFHSACLDKWFRKKHWICPLCKSVLVPTRDTIINNYS